jgi:hypothetical protein
MSSNCKNCGATIAAEGSPCPYCGSVNPKETSDGLSEKPIKTAVNEINSFVDPISNYKSSDNSIKPNFSVEQSGFSSSDKIWIGIGVVILVAVFFSFL